MHRARHSAAPRVIRTRQVVAMAVAAAGLVTAVWVPSRFDTAQATEGDRRGRNGGRVVFEDRFDGRRGDAANRAGWKSDTGTPDGDRQVFTDREGSARLDGLGNLVITARRASSGEITSARLRTRQTFGGESGRAEARVKVADDLGLRAAFQLLGAENVDVMEVLGDTSRRARGRIGDQEGMKTTRRSLAEDFHTYTVDWAPGRVVWSVDGDEFFRTGETLGEPFSPALSLAVSNRADTTTQWSQRMVVDYVRVTVRGDAGQEPPAVVPTTTPAKPPATPPTTPPTSEPPPAATTAPPAATTPPPVATTPPPVATTPPPVATTPPPAATTPPPVATTPPPPAAKAWKPFTLYAAGSRVTFGGVTYEVREAHTSLPGWEPPAVPTLFKAV